MPKFKAEYSAEDIVQLWRIRSVENDEGRIRDLATRIRDLCRLEHAVKIPKQYTAYAKESRTPYMRDAWHRITSSLVAKPPVAHCTPKDEDKQEYRDAANIAERFDQAMIERVCEERGADIVYDLAAQLVRDGESVGKVVHRPDAWANFPDRGDEDADAYNKRTGEYKHSADLPITWTDVDRLNVVYEGGQYGDDWLIEYGEYAKPYLRSRYGVIDTPHGRLANPKDAFEGKPRGEGLQTSGTGRSLKFEFWTPEEYHVLVDGSEVKGFPKENPYRPHIPYARARCYDGESLLYSLLYLVPTLDSLLTMKYVWSVVGGYPTPVIETVPNSGVFPGIDGPIGDAGEQATGAGQKKLTWSPGKVMDLPLGRKMSFLVPPPVGKDLNDLIVIYQQLISVAGIPSVMRGVSGAGDPGYLANQMLAAAQMAYKIALLASQRQLKKMTEITHWMIANKIKQTVYVRGWDALNPKTGKPKENASQAWLGLSPDNQSKNVADISKLGPVSYQYRAILPTDEQARAMIAMQVTNSPKPLYGRRDALEIWLQEEDPESILDRLYVEQALEEEPFKSIQVERALKKAGMLPIKKEPGPAAIPGAGMLPPGPNQLQGVPLANEAPPGMPGIPGLTMPIQPSPGVPGNVGGREPGMYPGQPGGPQG